MAALGLILLSFVKQASGPSSYWVTYFPGIFFFGLGMSFTVTPLTTTVMSAVASHYSGTASGVNNAISRIANVFANAILGALAILFFTAFLESNTKEISLTKDLRQQVVAESRNLGDAKVPSAIGEKNKLKIQKAYKESFIESYVQVMRICALLAILSALMAFVFIHNGELKRDE